MADKANQRIVTLAGGGGFPMAEILVRLRQEEKALKAFPKTVALELVSAGVSGTSLLFEIDEADSLARLEAAERFASGVRTVGCGLILDGFGRLSASFAALKALKVDFVKVDGSKLVARQGAN